MQKIAGWDDVILIRLKRFNHTSFPLCVAYVSVTIIYHPWLLYYWQASVNVA